MNQEETIGALANGGSYRATSYLVELRDATGAVIETIDAGTIKAIQRNGQRVTIRRRKGKDVGIDAAGLDDAGRLEIAVRGATMPAGQPVVVKKGGFGRFAMIGCGGLIGLIVLIVVIAAVSSVGGSSKSDTAGGAGAKSGQDVHTALIDGSTGTVKTAGDKVHKVTIVRVLDNLQSTNQFSQPKPGMKYFAVDALLENTSTGEISSGQWKLRGSNDFEYDRTFVSGIGQNFEVLQNLTPGAKTQGLVVFEIPADATPKFVRYDPNSFAKGDLYFDTQ